MKGAVVLRSLATVATILVVVAFAQPQTTRGCPIVADISPAKPSYLYKEPIAFRLKFLNKSSSHVSILIDEPFFGGDLTFTDSSGTLKLRTEYLNELSKMTGGGIAEARQLAPSESVSFPIFGQTYFESPALGSYELNYSVIVTCLNENEPERTTTSNGSVSFRVSASQEEQLKEIISAYGHQLESNDFSERRAAAEALSGMDTPLVIPELKKLMVLGDSRMAFQALARFKGNEEARKIVDSAVHSKRILDEISALNVLSKWNLAISKSDIQQFLTSQDKSLRLATLHYLESLGDSSNLPLVNGILDDPDAYISAEARRIKKLLESKSK